MPTLSNDYLDLRSAKSTKVREWFIADLIGEATYRTSLSILGLRGGDLEAEINHAKQEKANGTVHT